MSAAPKPIFRIIQADPDLADIIPAYLLSREAEVKILESALTRGDLKAIAKIGHNLRGTGTSYGFEDITEIGQTLESAARQKDLDSLSKAIKELQNYLGSLDVRYAA